MLRRRVRTTLCLIGVAIATTFIIAVGATTMRYTTVVKEMSVLFNGKIMVVSKGSIVIQAIPIGGSFLPMNFTQREIQNVTGVEKTVPVLFVTPIDIGGIIQTVPVNFSMGIPVNEWHEILGATPLRQNLGHFPTNESSSEIVVGVSLADQYNWTVGSRITMNDYNVEIVGVLDAKLAVLTRCVVMPLSLAQSIYNRPESVNIIAVKPATDVLEKELANAIIQKVDYIKALTEDERYDMIQPVLAQIETWNNGIQYVILIISLVLVMNVTIMSVSERRRDFATIDAIGAPLSFTFKTVLLESSLIGVLGGVIGLVFGVLSAIGLASFYSNIPVWQFFQSVFDIAPPFYMLTIFAGVVAVCCLGGIIPAVNATRMRIAETLRAEY